MKQLLLVLLALVFLFWLLKIIQLKGYLSVVPPPTASTHTWSTPAGFLAKGANQPVVNRDPRKKEYVTWISHLHMAFVKVLDTVDFTLMVSSHLTNGLDTTLVVVYLVNVFLTTL